MVRVLIALYFAALLATASRATVMAPHAVEQGLNTADRAVRVTALPAVSTRKDLYDKSLVVATVTLALVGGLQILFLWRTVQATRDNAKAARSSAEALFETERAWVLFEPGEAANLCASDNPKEHSFLFVAVKNYGKTPARIDRIAARFEIVNAGQVLPEMPNYPQGQGFNLNVDVVLASGGPMAPIPIPLPAPLILSAQQQQITLYAHGFVEYRDIGGAARRSAFCLSYFWPQPPANFAAGFYPDFRVPRAYTACT